MVYTEILPDETLSHHIECYWEMSSFHQEAHQIFELLLPTCTFNIIFTNAPCYIASKIDSHWIKLEPGAVFLGQQNSSILIQSPENLRLLGIRFKPFAFATRINTPIYQFNDKIIPIKSLFDLTNSQSRLISEIKEKALNSAIKIQLDELMYSIMKQSFTLDETLRAQLNYIMDRKGMVQIQELFQPFGTSKVTLRKHFINKVGLTPKKVSQIWRMNHLLNLKEEHPKENLTFLCLRAGFYDQPHFTKEFKSIFGIPPKRFFSQNSSLVKLAHLNISKRFSNQYDPRTT